MFEQSSMRVRGSKRNLCSPARLACFPSSYSPTAARGGHYSLHRAQNSKVCRQGCLCFPPLLLIQRVAAFSPHEAHAHQAFFGWILPTIRVSEYAVLQIVGLDAAVVRAHRRHENFHTVTGHRDLSFSTFTKCPSRCSRYAQYLRSQSSCLSTSRCVLVLPLSEQSKGVYVLIFFENSTTSILVTSGTRKTAS